MARKEDVRDKNPYILSARIRKYLYRECRYEIVGEMYEVNLAGFLCSFQRMEVAHHNDDDEVHCQRSTR